MLKKCLAALAALYAAASFAAVDVNKATAAELTGVKGIGPAMSERIVQEREKGSFKDWDDFKSRVKGVGDKTAVKLSEEGLTVGGAAYGKAPAGGKGKKAADKTADKASDKAADKAEAPAKDKGKAGDQPAEAEKKPAR